MSRILYFDCFSGISGDMTLGALIDAGLPISELQRALGSLALGNAHVHAEKVLRAGLSATKLTVHEHADGSSPHGHAERSTPDGPASDDHAGHRDHGHRARHMHSHAHAAERSREGERGEPGHHPHRSLGEIVHLIDTSALSQAGRDRAKTMFQRLAEVEAAMHHMPVEKVHLHEVGALDSIIDIVGTVFAMEWVDAEHIVCSPLNVGGGTVQSAHGVFPVPAPATAKLLAGAPVYGGSVRRELVTPTGALIATTYAESFGPLPPMTIERVGYGAGDCDDPGRPNVLRVFIGTTTDERRAERVAVIECEIDDMNPQIFGVAMDRLYAAGALEVFYTPVQMKKNRPGTLLTVVAPPERRAPLADIIFRETTTIGLRHYEVERECLEREIVEVATTLGSVRFKIARHYGRIVNVTPEFDDCARLAAAHNLSVKEVQAIALRAYHS